MLLDTPIACALGRPPVSATTCHGRLASNRSPFRVAVTLRLASDFDFPFDSSIYFCRFASQLGCPLRAIKVSSPVSNLGFPFDGVPGVRNLVQICGSPDFRKFFPMQPGFNLWITLTGFPKAVTRLHFPVLPEFIVLCHRASTSGALRRVRFVPSSCGEF